MAKQTTPKVNFKNLEEQGLYYLLNDQVSREKDLSVKIPNWIRQYVVRAEGQQVANGLEGILRRDPILIGELIDQSKEKHGNETIKEVKKSPVSVLKKTSQPYVEEIAEEFFGDDKYKKLRLALMNRGDLTGAFMSLYDKSDIWNYAVSRATSEAVQGAATDHFAVLRSQEAVRNLCEAKGDKVTYNAEKAAKYVSRNVLSEKDAAKKDNYFLKIGLGYVDSQAKKNGR